MGGINQLIATSRGPHLAPLLTDADGYLGKSASHLSGRLMTVGGSKWPCKSGSWATNAWHPVPKWGITGDVVTSSGWGYLLLFWDFGGNLLASR